MDADGHGPHCLCILLSQAVPQRGVRELLAGATAYREVANLEGALENWGACEPGIRVKQANEAIFPEWIVDVVSQPWPDAMGSRQRKSDLYAAWVAGQFGRGTFPGGLERACEQAWAWPEASQVVGSHRAFLRIRSCREVVSGERAPRLRAEAGEELGLWLRLVDRLMELPESLAFFNPGGEVVLDRSGFRQALDAAFMKELPPLDLWLGVRIFRVDANWVVMDMVGNSQFGEVDSETLFHGEDYSPDEVADFHWDMALKRMMGEAVSDEAHRKRTGPGGMVWQCLGEEEGMCDPPRPVHRWFPKDGRKPPLGMYGNET